MVLRFNPEGEEEFATAQVNGYYHTDFIHDWAVDRLESPGPESVANLTVNVNLNEYDGYTSCNAFYDDVAVSINFLKASLSCVNTAYDTILYHEYGHAVDDAIGGIPDWGLSEGWGDILGSHATNQPLLGEGLHGPGSYVRTADNARQYPADGRGEEHALGETWAGFAWHLRENLIESLGETAGIDTAEALVMPVILLNSPDIPNALWDLIELDDDDGTIENGTPHLAEIVDAANQHSLPLDLIGVAQLTSPAEDVELNPQYGPLVITGTATGVGFERYELFYQVEEPVGPWMPIGEPVLTPVEDGVLGPWAVQGLPPDAYTLQLRATVAGGVSLIAEATVTLDPSLPRHVTLDAADQQHPAIDGDLVVWEDHRHGNWDIFLHDLSTGVTTQITDNPDNQRNPAISGRRIVWEDHRDDRTEIYLYEMDTGLTTRLTNDRRRQESPDISGQWVVWEEEPDLGSDDIYLYDLDTQTGRFLTRDIEPQSDPAISGDHIVWVDIRNFDDNIYSHQISTGLTQRITSDQARVSSTPDPLDLSGHRIVWADERKNRYDVDLYLYDLEVNTEQPLLTQGNSQVSPAIAGDLVVWKRLERELGDIQMWNLNEELPQHVTDDNSDQETPVVSERWVVWQDHRNGNWDIFAAEVPPAP